MKSNASFVVYRGPSALDGATIRVVLTRGSANRKTGDMAQLFIVRDDVAPHIAQKEGTDASVCGDCPFRPANGGGCYVVTIQGPRAMFKASTGRAVDLDGALTFLRERASTSRARAVLRLGAYGDPAAVPEWVLQTLVSAVDNRATGYTHQWRKPEFQWLQRYCMASVENQRDTLIAWNRGWRTFRVTPNDATVLPREIVCVNESRGVSCEACGLCFGALRAKSITIPAHGFTVKRALSNVQ